MSIMTDVVRQLNEDFLQGKSKKLNKANAFCRVCKKDYRELKKDFTHSSKSYGEVEILFSARLYKSAVLVCSKCACTHMIALNCKGDAVLTYNNDNGKYRADVELVNSLTESVKIEEEKSFSDVLKGDSGGNPKRFQFGDTI